VRTWTRSRPRIPPALAELRLIAVGRIGRSPEAELFARYNDRLRPKLSVFEIDEARGSAGDIKRREAGAMFAALPPKAFVVALDLGGRAPDSETFSALMTRWLETTRSVCFLIGGAEGLDQSVIARADHILSFGPLTWPHLMVRVMLAEQVFRARAIAAGHPYHRPGRP
jgi:23S rRNA (pseudouridine1915-N3)-methyltransferase